MADTKIIVEALSPFALVALFFGVMPLVLAGEFVWLVTIIGMPGIFVIPAALAELSPALIWAIHIIDKREKNQMIDGIAINEQPDEVLKRNKNVKTVAQVVDEYTILCNKEAPQRNNRSQG